MRIRSKLKRGAAEGFSLVELAVVMAIVAFLLGSLMYTLSAQTEQRSFEDTRRRLDQARELLLAFSIVKGRLPCPARYTSTASNSQGLESFCSAASPATCAGSETTTEQTHGNCSNYVDGYLPAASLGWQQTDSSGFAIDTWGNRIRYAVAKLNTNCSTSPPANTILFTSASNLKTYGISCQPNDLLVCKSATGITSSDCGGAANQIMTQSLLVAVVYSTGKNGATGGTGLDEAANLNGDRVFVWHTPAPSTATNGEFDDQFTWVTVGELYGRLIAAGVLP
jgi:prepilin-type N-terminal cleavage/methylation domain-containing protein